MVEFTLQSKLNEKTGRALYLCPNKFLVNQTLLQAKQFGIKCVGVDIDGSLPASFLEGESILVAPVQKLFNGKTKFGLDAKSMQVDYLVIDDAHACIDSIKSACQITLKVKEEAYQRLLQLFEDDLKEQGAGSFAEIKLNLDESGGPILPVPYWAWSGREEEISKILAKNMETDSIKFVWPLLRDRLKYCQCVVSSSEIVIAPYLAPLQVFGSYFNALHRVFMTATVSDDSFLVKGLGLDPEVVIKPVTDPNEKWSGEKMVLIPSLIAEDLDQGFITAEFGKKHTDRKTGVVILTPSFRASDGWDKAGAIVCAPTDIDHRVESLRNGDCSSSIVVVNRYDGIDLPDDSCRILIIDGKPFADSLLDRYLENCRPSSEIIAARVARTIEQGLGRAVRGERDYCVILIVGSDLVKVMRSRETKVHFSAQTRTQVELGMENSELAREDVANGATPYSALIQLMRQCLTRNPDWKDFYVERMNDMDGANDRPKLLEIFSAELKAETEYQSGHIDKAVQIIQNMLDKCISDSYEKGWYLQEMARYKFDHERSASVKLQQDAHRINRLLLKPESVVTIRLTSINQHRSEAINTFIRKYESYQALDIHVTEVLSNLKFGVRADNFEKSWGELGRLLGFQSERPDKEWKQGPDNLWAIKHGEYLLVECKNEVELTRSTINKQESGQMNNAIAWFDKEYNGCMATRILIIPTPVLSDAAGFNQEVRIMRKAELGRLVARVKMFFKEFSKFDLSTVSELKINELLKLHKLEMAEFSSEYSVPTS